MAEDEKEHERADPPLAVSQETTGVQCCPECGSTRLMRDYETAEIVCMDCGLIIAQKIADRGPEWRAFDDEQRT
ncbi:transcription initiation factor IIB, partial [Candidatus Bathyarchaeota archaeon]